jgi:hypothetical protein
MQMRVNDKDIPPIADADYDCGFVFEKAFSRKKPSSNHFFPPRGLTIATRHLPDFLLDRLCHGLDLKATAKSDVTGILGGWLVAMVGPAGKKWIRSKLF